MRAAILLLALAACARRTPPEPLPVPVEVPVAATFDPYHGVEGTPLFRATTHGTCYPIDAGTGLSVVTLERCSKAGFPDWVEAPRP